MQFAFECLTAVIFLLVPANTCSMNTRMFLICWQLQIFAAINCFRVYWNIATFYVNGEFFFNYTTRRPLYLKVMFTLVSLGHCLQICAAMLFLWRNQLFYVRTYAHTYVCTFDIQAHLAGIVWGVHFDLAFVNCGWFSIYVYTYIMLTLKLNYVK